jgi:uncharacterized protein YndB with AHSA1/START domain
VRRTFEASREEVFRIWSDPREVVKWWPPEGYTDASAEGEVKVGGTFRIGMKAPDGEEPFFATGTYLEVEPPARVVHTWRWEGWPEEQAETRVTIEFHEKGEKTEVVLKHTGFSTRESADMHQDGWNGCLERASALL